MGTLMAALLGCETVDKKATEAITNRLSEKYGRSFTVAALGNRIGRDTATAYVFADEDLRYQHAQSVAAIALRRAAAGEILTYDRLMPEYMRLAEAEQRLKAGTLSDRIRKPVKI